MSETASFHIGDVGGHYQMLFKDENNAVVNLSAATLKQITFRKPGGGLLVKSGASISFVTDGSDGLIEYVWLAGDLDVDGNWTAQGYLEFATGKYHSTDDNFRVTRSL